MLTDFLRALRQLGDPRFRRVLWLGLALTLALLIAVYVVFLWLLQSVIPEAVNIPFIGPISGLHALVSWGSALLIIVLSVFLMMPVASAFTGLFLEDVAQAVEDLHYPTLSAVPRLKLSDSRIDAANFFALLIAVKVAALLLYAFAGPLVPVMFWAINGFLLGREYFTLVAMRRLGREGARSLRRHHAGQIWLAGTLMAVPLSIPLINLLIPVLGVATFTHLFHRLNRAG
ncbi:MAG: EI24 domain-containing protein [Paracoccaceae bacterium]|nr:EI24 domain-containing protein [Paracoccaceae bacterium]